MEASDLKYFVSKATIYLIAHLSISNYPSKEVYKQLAKIAIVKMAVQKGIVR